MPDGGRNHMLKKIKQSLKKKPDDPEIYRKQAYIVLGICFAVSVTILILTSPF